MMNFGLAAVVVIGVLVCVVLGALVVNVFVDCWTVVVAALVLSSIVVEVVERKAAM
jgi:hypothetical protein